MALGVAGAGCDSGSTGGTSNPGEGSIELALTNAPSDALCLKVTVEATRNLTKMFDLTPGASTKYLIDRVPVGRAVVDGVAYGTSCASVSGDPLFVSEAPVPVRVDPKEIAQVTLKLIRNGRIAVGVDFESSPSSYLVPSAPAVEFKDIITTGDVVDGYKMAGTPDGLGAFDNGDGTFTVIMGHEFGSTAGAVRAHGAKGSFISKWVIRKSDLTVLSGGDMIKQVALWNPATSSYNAPTTGVAFNRFCSGDLPALSAFYDAASGLGYNGRLFTDGEEAGLTARAFAHTLDGTTYELPRMGKQSWENIVANPATGVKTVVAGSDDSTPGQIYIYVGDKTASGSPVEMAGLTNGTLYGVSVTGFADEIAATGIPSGTAFALASLGNVENMTGAALETAADAGLVTHFNRPEDVAWDPTHPNDLYFVTTASFSTASRLWRLRFADITNPALGGTIDMLADGTEGQKMFDNITVDRSGHVILQEDVGNNVRLGKVWRYDIANDTLTELGQHDPQRFLSGAPLYLTQDEESSGVIDVAGILGAGWYLLDVQAHYATDAETVEGGQLIAMYAPSWQNLSPAPVDLAVIGDTPYGATQIADFPNLVAAINGAAGISATVHVGDTKSGSTRCDNSYFEGVIYPGFQSFTKPLIYSPGDNEWTDCHRANNGAYDPLERLNYTRTLFFPFPGRTLGAVKRDVLSQSALPAYSTFVENVMWSDAQVTFATLHVVGSNNSLLPWYTDDTTGTKVDNPTGRTAEEAAREAAAVAWIDSAFAFATKNNHKAVALFMQADMWDPSNFPGSFSGFVSIVRKLAEDSVAFGKPVLLINGDSHVFEADHPLASGDANYGVTTPVPNLTRVTVQGSTTAPLTEWLRLHVDPASAAVFSWTRNPR